MQMCRCTVQVDVQADSMQADSMQADMQADIMQADMHVHVHAGEDVRM